MMKMAQFKGISLDTERAYEQISPFEFKNKLISLAQEQEKKSAKAMLNAGRGNPNWVAATPREAFFTLGQFAVSESRRVWNQGDLAGQPEKQGIADRIATFIAHNRSLPGIELLKRVVDYGANVLGFDADSWVFELVDGIIGDNYPTPDRMLEYVEKVVREFLQKALFEGQGLAEEFDLFAVEGATAGMCYIFDSLLANQLLTRGDKVAIMVPIFPPYFEIPQLDRYHFTVVEIRANGMDEKGAHTWQYPLDELKKLEDPSIKALFLVNPSNPPSVAMAPDSVQVLIDIVKNNNPQLMIISDDVYGTFVDHFHSLLAELPFNTIGVYSFSKYFGVTGWRLGVVAIHQRNVFDERLRQLPRDQIEALHSRYASLSQHPVELRFMDRLVADSRQVAMNHTAGLSTPQQVQMVMFAAFALLDQDNRYQELTKTICRRRIVLLYEGLELPIPQLEHDADYYTEFDLMEWATNHYGDDFARYLKANYEPLDILFRLAEFSSIVLLNGGGFHGPTWSIRVSLANLNDQAYERIGQELHHALDEYVTSWETSK
jgi:aspartate 4-decarboxylase